MHWLSAPMELHIGIKGKKERAHLFIIYLLLLSEYWSRERNDQKELKLITIIGNQVMLTVREIVFPNREHTNRLCNTKLTALKAYIYTSTVRIVQCVCIIRNKY